MNKSDDKMKGSGLSIDRAAFVLLRVKRVFRKKKQQLKEKNMAADIKPAPKSKPPPLLRSRTLPSIVVPGLSILQAQIDAKYKSGQLDGGDRTLNPPKMVYEDDAVQGRCNLAHHRLSSPEPAPNMSDDGKNLSSSHFLTAGRSYRLSSNSSLSSTTLNRLAKLLNQRGTTNLEAPAEDSGIRRLSWEKRTKEESTIHRSSSIDSMVEVAWQCTDSAEQPRRVQSPLLCRTERLGSLVSPSLGRRLKGSRAVTGMKEDRAGVCVRESDPFRPQICLKNKIIEDLTSKYKAQLAPLSLRNISCRKSCLSKAPAKRVAFKEDLRGRDVDDVKKTVKKGVTFLDEKLRNGFANAGFLHSPTSECAGEGKGIVNPCFRCSPGQEPRRVRPKPIASPSEEFLQELDAPSPNYARLTGITNDAFVESPETARNSEVLHPGGRASCREQKADKMSKESLSEEGNVCKIGAAFADDLPPDRLPPESRAENSGGENSWFTDTDLEREMGNQFKLESTKYLKWKHGSMSTNSPEEDPALDPPHPEPVRELPVQSESSDVRDSENHSLTIDLGRRGMDFWVDGFKANKKKLDKINKINIHLHALFSAVEHGHVEKARTILESTDVDVNSLNVDNLTPLDVAVLTNHRSLAKMLLAFGAQEGNYFPNPERLGIHLRTLIAEAEKRIQDLNGDLLTPDQNIPHPLNNNRASFSAGSHHSGAAVTGCHGGTADSEKELLLWERKAKGLKKMLLGFEQTRPPEVPQLVAVDVTGTNSVLVRFQGPEHQESSICTKFKVQWSKCETFSVITGEREITDMKQLDCSINDLSHGKRYWFRMACGNLKGYGNFKSSTPYSVVPSSWRDAQKREPRFGGRLHQLDDLFSEIRNLRPENASEIKDFSDPEKQGDTPALQRRNQKKKTTIKQLFTVTGKFQKNLKRGIYLVSLFYHNDRVLVTNEDFLPAVEVDETYPNSIYNDLHWFMKVACTWSDVKSLRQDMEKNLTSTTSHFRIKLLQAAQQMQSSLSTQDLGQLYYRPIRDAQGTLAFCTINHCPTPKSISVLNLRWTPISKIQKKVFASEESNISELLMTSIPSQITYHQHTNIKLSRGLYLGFLKMRSSVDLIQIIVPSKTPNVLPHYKVRDNPHISAEEWEWLKRSNGRRKSGENLQNQSEAEAKDTEQQQIFVEQVASTARRLFSYLDVNLEDAMSHRLYDLEVVDLNSDISFLIIVPPAETSCSVPGQKDVLLERGDLMSIPVQVFEMVHLGTYQPEVISRYSRLSCILELDMILAQHSHREAFSSSEVQVTKSRLSKLQELQTQLNLVWKSVRWIMDVITFARDRGTSPAGMPAAAKAPAAAVHGGQNSKCLQNTGAVSNVLAAYNTWGVPGVSMKNLLALTRKKESSKKSPSRLTKSKCLKENHQHVKCEKRSLLQIPDSPKDPKLLKSNFGRGSWPGPDVENETCLLESSFSKSEQHLNVCKDDGDIKDIGRKYSGSDCSGSSNYVTIQSASNSSNASQYVGRFGADYLGRKVMTCIGNRLPFSKSEDHLLMSQDLRSFKHSRDHKESRSKSNVVSTVSVSATNSPLLPPKHLYSNLANTNADSSLSIANTNTSGSLRSISSDESTAAVVSLPVTIPMRNRVAPATGSFQHSASLLSLAKPIVPTGAGTFAKPKVPVTSSLNSLTEKPSAKRTVNPPTSLITTGSLLSGNTIPVNINQIPARSSELSSPVDVSNVLNRHISSSLPSFNPLNSGSAVPGFFGQCKSPGRQRQSPVKCPGNPIDAVFLGGTSVKRSEVEPFIMTDLDLLHHPGVPLDSPGSPSTSVSHNSALSSSINSESTASLLASSVNDNDAEDTPEDMGSGVKVPTPTSGVLQVYAAYETGLAAGTSLKLHVTPRTSAREVVDLVVKQLNMAVLLKGKDGPIYLGERLKNFCLVAVIGARERCLRDDFKPLQLQNPWKKGRLYVRQKQDVLAALEHSSRQSAFLSSRRKLLTSFSRPPNGCTQFGRSKRPARTEPPKSPKTREVVGDSLPPTRTECLR